LTEDQKIILEVMHRNENSKFKEKQLIRGAAS